MEPWTGLLIITSGHIKAVWTACKIATSPVENFNAGKLFAKSIKVDSGDTIATHQCDNEPPTG
jgi:hypothetical protein